MNRRTGLLGTGLSLLLSGLAAEPVQAQWGYGWGLFGGFQPSPATQFYSQRALVGAARASGPGPLRQTMPMYGGRDPEFFQRYDISTRRALEDQVRSHRPRPGTTTIAAATPKAAPTPKPPTVLTTASVPLTSFFNRYDELVWPSEAPIEGELEDKRKSSDAASLAAVKEQRAQGRAEMATAVEARNRLLEYGRPALALVRSNATPRAAETFHGFLMSLYDAIGASINPPKPSPP